MGLLTSSGSSEKLSNFILKRSNFLSVVCYVGGIAWFMALAWNGNNAATYFSENALLPGLVDTEFNLDRDASDYLQRLQEEMESHKMYVRDMPTAWLQGQFRRLGLEVYAHNFTLNYPLGLRNTFTGVNMYAIMRARRASGTEALVINVPYRPLNSMHENTSPGIAMMLALARFFKRKSYWSKDVIFLITEHEQLGVHAWLNAYYSSHKNDDVLHFGQLESQSGKIQAAIVLELHGHLLSKIDVKVEGQTGQLPNLDLFNLVVRLCGRESIPVTFKNKGNHPRPLTYQGWLHQFRTMIAMLKTQASGTPSGNHGHFLRFGVEAVTLEGFKSLKSRGVNFRNIGRMLEGTFRSLNNLLESLHQSFFFYILPATDRYVSIGLYMPSFGLILLPMMLGALRLRISMSAKTESATKDKPDEKQSFVVAALPHLVFAHSVGFALTQSPSFFDAVGLRFGLNSGQSILIGLISVFLSIVVLFILFQRKSTSLASPWEAVKCVALLETSLLLGSVSLVNFSLGFGLAVVMVPAMTIVSPTSSKIVKSFKSILLLCTSPIGLAFVTILVDTWTIHSTSSSWNVILGEVFAVSKRAILFAVTDYLIYGNWLFPVACVFHFATWILFWCVLHMPNGIKSPVSSL